MVYEVVYAVLGMSYQRLALVLMPTFRAFVWDCKVQPIWSAGHEIVRLPPETLLLITGDGGAVVKGPTRNIPSFSNVLVFQARWLPGYGGLMMGTLPLMLVKPWNSGMA